MKFYHPLMHQNFSRSDTRGVIKLFKQKRLILTQSKNVKKFETMWSKWLGVKYSVFVNSGSSANLLTIAILKILFKNKKEIIVPSLTWVSDINSVIQNGFKPVFVDIKKNNLSMDENKIEEKITKKTKLIIATSIFGQCPEIDEINTIAKKYSTKDIEHAHEKMLEKDKKKVSTGLVQVCCF